MSDTRGWLKRRANPRTVTCSNPGCGRKFTTPAPKRQNYCSVRCRKQAAYKRKTPEVSVTCQNPGCGKRFTTRSPRKAKYCSMLCKSQAKYKRANPSAYKNPRAQARVFRCQAPGCGRTFTSTKANALYCSGRCRQRVSRAIREERRRR